MFEATPITPYELRPRVCKVERNGEVYIHTLRSSRVVSYSNPEDWIEYVPARPCASCGGSGCSHYTEACDDCRGSGAV